MAVREQDVELIVRQILSEMGKGGSAPAPAAAAPKAAGGAIPKRARVAMLTELGKFELQEYDIPALGDDDILVKVEGCGVCGTDAHEFLLNLLRTPWKIRFFLKLFLQRTLKLVPGN